MSTTSTAATPSSTFSNSVVNAVLGMFLESAATIEEIANQNNLSIPKVLECLEEQKAFLVGMLSTLELRVRLIASRAEAVAIESLREIASLARDQESRRKAASKLLSHFGKSKSQRASAPSPRPAGRSVTRAACDDEGSVNLAQDLQPVPQRAPGVGGASPRPHSPPHSSTITCDPAPSPLHTEGVADIEPRA